jgi:hypothetical protein
MTLLLEFMNLFSEFRASSWDGWRRELARLTPNVREFFAIVGRGAGKSRIVALLACCFASREYRCAPGERVYIGVFGPDRKQAGVTFRYIVGLLRSVPALAALIVSDSKDSIELANGVTIEVITASIAAPRGRAYVLAIVEEAAFLPNDESANPDVELLRALRPALARVPGSLLAVVSSNYARRGVLWTAWQKYHGQPDNDVVLVQAATLELNPTFDRRAIETAFEEDPASAAAEYGAQFRSDVDTFVSPEAIADCVVLGRHELPWVDGVSYEAFVDPAGGSGADSFTLAIGHRGHRKEQTIRIVDALRERRPPFSPEQVIAEYAALLKAYRVSSVTGDRFAGEFPREIFRRHGIDYDLADRTKSELYKDALALLNSGHLELLDHPRLVAQLGALERHTARGGRDTIDHAPGGHDDLANVVCGLAILLSVVRPAASATWGGDRWGTEDRSPASVITGPLVPWYMRVTEDDLLDALRSLGDEMVDDYKSGKLPRETALRIAVERARQYDELELFMKRR